MKIVAPLAGAGIYAWAGGHAVALIDAAALLVSAALYTLVRAKPIPPPTREKLAAPVRFLLAHKRLRNVVLAIPLGATMVELLDHRVCLLLTAATTIALARIR
jgi:hypothetical protein